MFVHMNILCYRSYGRCREPCGIFWRIVIGENLLLRTSFEDVATMSEVLDH